MRRSKKSSRIFLCLVILACCTPHTDTKESKKTTSADNASPAVAESNSDEIKELKRLEEEARKAVMNENWPDAKQLIRQGLRQTEQNRDLDLHQARFLLLKGEAALHHGDRLNARRYFSDAMAIFHVRKNEPGRFETFLALGRLEARSGDYAAAERQFSEAKSLEAKITDKSLKGRFLVEQGRLAARTVDHKKAAEFFTKALLLFDALKNNRMRAETLLLLSAEEEMLGRLGSARQSLYRASKLFETAGFPSGKVKAVHRLATYAEREKKYAMARRLYNEALALYEQLDQQTAATNVARHLSALPTVDKDSQKKKSR